MNVPPAIIFINAEINDGVKVTLTTQLFLDEVISFDEFNSRVSGTPTYPDIVHLQNRRILVVVPDLRNTTNRSSADLVLFYNQGQVTVEKNNYGPPGISLEISRINIYELLRDVGSKNVTILPVTSTRPPRALGGIVVDQLADSSGVHDPNPDNIYNNPDFINRK
jgi:hypothetical protein